MKVKKTFFSILGILLLIGLPLIFKSQYFISILIMVMLYIVYSGSWNILGGFAGQLSFGHAIYIGVGAYVSTCLFAYYNVSPWIGMLAGGLVAGLLSLVVAWPCFKLKGSYFALATTAMVHVVQIVFKNETYIFGLKTNAAVGLRVPWRNGFWNMQFKDNLWYYYIIFAFAVMVFIISRIITRSKMGYYLRAIKNNQEAALALGINSTFYKTLAQFIGAFIAAIGGTFYAQYILILDPNAILDYALSVQCILIAIVGGRGTVWGPVIGAAIMVPINELMRSSIGTVVPGVSYFIYGVLLMIMVFYCPDGLAKYIVNFLNKIFGDKRKIPLSEI